MWIQNGRALNLASALSNTEHSYAEHQATPGTKQGHQALAILAEQKLCGTASARALDFPAVWPELKNLERALAAQLDLRPANNWGDFFEFFTSIKIYYNSE